jgi:hypothetical protein
LYIVNSVFYIECPTLSAPFVEKTILSLHNCLSSFINYQLSIYVCVQDSFRKFNLVIVIPLLKSCHWPVIALSMKVQNFNHTLHDLASLHLSDLISSPFPSAFWTSLTLNFIQFLKCCIVLPAFAYVIPSTWNADTSFSLFSLLIWWIPIHTDSSRKTSWTS